MNKKFTVILEEDPETKDLIMPLPDGMCDELGWEIGDSLDWSPSPDGSFLLSKKQTQWVLVECVSTFRQRYMVEVPVGTDDLGKDKTLWALDTVTMEEAKEFSQEHIGEQIVVGHIAKTGGARIGKCSEVILRVRLQLVINCFARGLSGGAKVKLRVFGGHKCCVEFDLAFPLGGVWIFGGRRSLQYSEYV